MSNRVKVTSKASTLERERAEYIVRANEVSERPSGPFKTRNSRALWKEERSDGQSKEFHVQEEMKWVINSMNK